jgi:hypothetical protein
MVRFVLVHVELFGASLNLFEFFFGVVVSQLDYSREYVIASKTSATKAQRINTHTHTHKQSPSQDTDPRNLFLSFQGVYADARRTTREGVVFLTELHVAMRSVQWALFGSMSARGVGDGWRSTRPRRKNPQNHFGAALLW